MTETRLDVTSETRDSENREFAEYTSIKDAQEAAFEDATATGGRVYPCIVFRQGKRWMISTSFSYVFLQRQVQPDAAMKGESPRDKTNRPLIPEHVRTIQSYMRQNPDQYIMPPVTLNVRKKPQVHLHKSSASVRSGYLVIDDSTKFYVTDGQHRIAAIAGHATGKRPVPGIVDEIDEFRDHGVAVQLVWEEELGNIHQDFADAAQTKPIPASLLATYNMREPINRVLGEIVVRSFFNGRVEETSKTLPKLSQYMFLLNQVRGFVKELLVSDYAMAEPQLERHAKERIGSAADQNAFIDMALDLLEVLSLEMTPWKQIKSLPLRSDALNRIPDYRTGFINMTATGLVVIGRVAYIINKLHQDPEERRQLYRRLASEIDWRRDGELWQGSIINEDGKIQTQRSPVKIAVKRVTNQLGISNDSFLADEVDESSALEAESLAV